MQVLSNFQINYYCARVSLASDSKLHTVQFTCSIHFQFNECVKIIASTNLSFKNTCISWEECLRGYGLHADCFQPTCVHVHVPPTIGVVHTPHMRMQACV